ncbi:MAG: hypothetical protein IPO93_18400 [Actinobacteria bacterium]|jgi:hypothetical protein|nr:hypothetical protein [Actinomycetota bacterium]
MTEVPTDDTLAELYHARESATLDLIQAHAQRAAAAFPAVASVGYCEEDTMGYDNYDYAPQLFEVINWEISEGFKDDDDLWPSGEELQQNEDLQAIGRLLVSAGYLPGTCVSLDAPASATCVTE